jgi:hypothetical protein
VVPELGPGASVDVRVDIGSRLSRTDRLATMVIPAARRNDQTAAIRRAILDQVSGYSNMLGTGGLQANPVILAFRPGPTLTVGTGSSVRQEGDTLYLMPATARLDGAIILPDPLFSRSVLETHASEAWDNGTSWSLGPGWMTVELRPVMSLDGAAPGYLGLALTQDEGRLLTGRGLDVEPLPPDRQPAQDDPMTLPSSGPTDAGQGQAAAMGVQLPAFQLFDQVAGSWVEFPATTVGREMRIVDPARYLDGSGALRLRFVNRIPNSSLYFGIAARMEADQA